MHFGHGLAAALCAAVMASLAIPATVEAASLAGQVGDKRRGQVLPAYTRGSCGAAWSRPATRPISVARQHEAIFCGIDRNASSQKAAEQRAIARCNGAKSKYKMRSIGPCEIVASK